MLCKHNCNLLHQTFHATQHFISLVASNFLCNISFRLLHQSFHAIFHCSVQPFNSKLWNSLMCAGCKSAIRTTIYITASEKFSVTVSYIKYLGQQIWYNVNMWTQHTCTVYIQRSCMAYVNLPGLQEINYQGTVWNKLTVSKHFSYFSSHTSSKNTCVFRRICFNSFSSNNPFFIASKLTLLSFISFSSCSNWAWEIKWQWG